MLPEVLYRNNSYTFFAGLGIGTSIIHEAKFSNPVHVNEGLPFISLSEKPRFSGAVYYFAASAGLIAYVTNYLGIKMAALYRNSTYTEKIDDQARLGFNQGGVVIGLNYRFVQ